MASGAISIALGLGGPNFAIVSACSTGAHAIGEAFETIKRGDATAMIAGGAEAAIQPISIASFGNMHATSRRNDDPEHASRPFDAGRDGFVMGEGAGILVLEEMERAKRRGATIYAEVLGLGTSFDAYAVTKPDPEGGGAARAITWALQEAKVDPADVDYSNAHGTSTRLNDQMETMAVKKVFGEKAH